MLHKWGYLIYVFTPPHAPTNKHGYTHTHIHTKVPIHVWQPTFLYTFCYAFVKNIITYSVPSGWRFWQLGSSTEQRNTRKARFVVHPVTCVSNLPLPEFGRHRHSSCCVCLGKNLSMLDWFGTPLSLGGEKRQKKRDWLPHGGVRWSVLRPALLTLLNISSWVGYLVQCNVATNVQSHSGGRGGQGCVISVSFPPLGTLNTSALTQF